MNGWRKRKHWEWARQWASLLDDLLPANVCEAALATCQLTLQGPKSVGNTAKNWGRWIRMRMQTFGYVPNGICAAVQKSRNWIGTDSHEAANVVLSRFGLSLDSVFDYYGLPAEGEKLILDLPDVITAIEPEFATPPAAAA